MSNQVTLDAAKDFFQRELRPTAPSSFLAKARWHVLSGVPHLLDGARSMHFQRCECGEPDCLGIKPVPGVIH